MPVPPPHIRTYAAPILAGAVKKSIPPHARRSMGRASVVFGPGIAGRHAETCKDLCKLAGLRRKSLPGKDTLPSLWEGSALYASIVGLRFLFD